MKILKVNKRSCFLIISAICTAILGLLCHGCLGDTHEDNFGVKVTNDVSLIGHRNSVTKLFYKGKMISSNLFYDREKSYRLSPDKNKILFIEYSLYARRYGIYLIPEDRTVYFHQAYDIIELRDYEDERQHYRIEWDKEKIVISRYSSKCILHINDAILEKCSKHEIYSENPISYNSLYEYLLILIKQQYERINKYDRYKYFDIFKPYLRKLPIKVYYDEITPLNLIENKHLFDKVGETFKLLVEKLGPKYSKTNMYRIFQKNYREKFELIDGKVKLRQKGLLW
jgi:hypothetical protein